jgi:hypothetical protein
MTSDALWVRTLNGRAKEAMKEKHSTEETLLAQMVEAWRLQQWIVTSDL